ncbi:hypothetical protein, partial [Tenacibaculum maritimum]
VIYNNVLEINTLFQESLNKIQLPETIWNPDAENYTNNDFHFEPLEAGLIDGAIEEIKSIPLLISLAVDYSTNPKTREKINKAFSDFDFTNAMDKWYESRKDLYTSGTIHKIEYRTGKDVVEVGTLIGTGGLATLGKIKKGTDLVEGVTSAIKKVAKEGESVLLSVFKSNLKNRIAKESNMTLRYVDDELSAIISNGKKLNLPEKEIEDIIFNGCRNSKKFTKDELISQTNFWKKVKDKGYPTSLFKTLNEYEKFGEAVKGLAKKWGLPENSIFVQGSSLKVSDISKIGDLDIAIKVDINTFDNLVAKFKKAARDVKIKNRIGNNGKIGGGDMFSPDVSTRQSFTTNAYTEIEKAFGGINFTQKFGVEKLQISIIKESGKLDVSPYLLVK